MANTRFKGPIVITETGTSSNAGNQTIAGTLAVTGAITATAGVTGTLTGNQVMPVAAVAAAGSAQGDAGACVAGFSHVTGADATKGARLPAAAAGVICIIKNSDAANAVLKLYPASGDAINALSANASLDMAAKTSVFLIALDATTWYSLPLLPS